MKSQLFGNPEQLGWRGKREITRDIVYYNFDMIIFIA